MRDARPVPRSRHASYVELNGKQVYRQPYAVRNASYYYFAVPGRWASLQATLDRILNKPAGRAVEYALLSDHAFVHFGIALETGSLHPPDSELGTYVERSAAIWLLVQRGLRPMLFPVYYFVDVSPAMASGREVYGINKAMADIAIPEQHPDRSRAGLGTFQLDTVVLDDFSPGTCGRIASLLELRHSGLGGTSSDTPDVWQNLMEKPKQAFDRLISTVDPLADAVVGHGTVAHHLLLALMRQFEYPVVFLRQLRDVAQSDRAAYQAIIEAPARVLDWRDGGFLTGEYEMVVHPYDSHPLVSDFGFQRGPQPVAGGFWVDYDFALENGKEVWNAQTNSPTSGASWGRWFRGLTRRIPF